MKSKLFALVAVSTILLSGCVTREIQLPGGGVYRSTSFLTNPNVGPITYRQGDSFFEVKGYSHEQQEAAKALLAIIAAGK